MKDRQDLVVRTVDGPGSIRLSGEGKNGVYTTHVRKGELLVFSRRGHIVARFAKGAWQYMFAQEQVVQR
jgi:hypothetical protein